MSTSRPGAPTSLVANHLSLLDILRSFRLFKDFAGLEGGDLQRFPALAGTCVEQYIPLKRGDRESIAEMMAASEETLRSGSSIAIFPRARGPRRANSKTSGRGAFDMARDTDCARPDRHSRNVQCSPEARIHPPGPPSDFSDGAA